MEEVAPKVQIKHLAVILVSKRVLEKALCLPHVNEDKMQSRCLVKGRARTQSPTAPPPPDWGNWNGFWLFLQTKLR